MVLEQAVSMLYCLSCYLTLQNDNHNLENNRFIIFSGAVLVFLPGYDDIITLKDQLSSSKEFGNTRMYVEGRKININRISLV